MLLSSLRKLIEEKTGEKNFNLEEPEVNGRGDFATNVAFLLAKRKKTSPIAAAEELKNELSGNKLFEKVEVSQPGFINFWISKEAVERELVAITSEKNYREIDLFKGKKIIVEYTDPNPFKEFHIGHLMTNVIGESIARLYEAAGGEVIRVNYQGDIGIHVACGVWGMTHHTSGMPDDSAPLREKITFLGRAYAIGAKAYKEDMSAKKEIKELNKNIYENRYSNELYIKGRKWSLDYFETIYARLATKFKHYFFESEIAPIGIAIVESCPDIFEESKGAVIFPGEKYGLHNRVFINSFGLPTYETKELGLNKMKFDIYHPDLSVVITGNEINDYFRVLLKVMELTIPEVAAKTKHIGHGMLRLPIGKMSSRTGDVITAESLINDVKKAVQDKIKNREDLEDIEKEEIKEQVALSAIRYSILKQSIGKDIIFDLDNSISFHGDSGPYIQYTYARLRSILRKEELTRLEPQDISMETDSPIILKLAQFPEAVRRATENHLPSYLASYLYDLAQLTNNYYNMNPILQSEPKVRAVRLNLIKVVAETLKNGLNLLGIQTLERM